jgi:hypothetical protein
MGRQQEAHGSIMNRATETVQTLHVFTKEIVLSRRMVTPDDQQALLDVGCKQRHLREVVIGVAH